MTYVIKFVCQNKIFIKLLLRLRRLLAENKIPDTLFDRLKNYTPVLSENIPDLEMINKSLEHDICYLNSREEFINIRELSKMKCSKKDRYSIAGKCRQHNAIKYHKVRIIGYQDIIELDAMRDRVFVLDINMHLDNPGSMYALHKLNRDFLEEQFHYTIKLSSLMSKF